MARHTDALQEDSQQLTHNWPDEVDLSNNYGQYCQQFIDMLSEFEHMWDRHLGRINAAKHRIELNDRNTAPVHSTPYRAGPKTRGFERVKIDKMLVGNIIEPAQTEWASPIVFAPKEDGTLRFCVDYRKLNAVTKRDSSPIPRMEECIESLDQATVFSTLDANSGH